MTPLQRLRRYVEMRRNHPLRGLGESIHQIHSGTEWEAEVRLADLEAILPLCSEAVERDAARWRHAVKYGFPVRNQSPHSEDLRWVVFREKTLMHLGSTPGDAIDAAMSASSETEEGK